MHPAHLILGLMRRFGIDKIAELEREFAARPDAIHAAPESPPRFDIIGNSLASGKRPPFVLRAMPHMIGSMRGILRSLRSLDGNPPQPKTRISDADLADLEAYARTLGVSSLGYARVPRAWVFENMAILHGSAMVLTMPMDRAGIDSAPSPEGFFVVQETYHHLGDAANHIADFLRARGYSAHAGHALNGPALYPPLAEKAGLGFRGHSGLLITPEHGPTVRLAAVFTGIDNLPFYDTAENPHAWVADYCALCGMCVRGCPVGAIREAALPYGEGLVSCIETDTCFDFFHDNYGCSVCVQVCPFHKHGYAKIKAQFERSQARRAAPV